jgi:hypothetical protein
MNPERPEALARTQRLLRRLITAPSGVRAALKASGDPEGRALAAVLQGDARLDAESRLDVYAYAYFHRILDCLKEDYAALHAAMGEELFHDLITEYLVVYPPTRFSLRFAGEHLPAFLASRPEGSQCCVALPWGADLAALEWALVEVFDAADAPVLAREELAAVPPEAWVNLRFAFTPALRVLHLEWPVQRIREAFDAEGGTAPSIDPAPVSLLVWRRDERVFYRSMEAIEDEAIEVLRGGGAFGALCERIARNVGEAEAPARTLALLNGWIADGLLSSLSL